MAQGTRKSKERGIRNGLKLNSKYNSKKAVKDGYIFDSKKERYRYTELKSRAIGKDITNLTLQPKFILQEGFRDRNGNKRRPITYTADFLYFEVDTETWVVEDVKGMSVSKNAKRNSTITDVFRMKMKMFLYHYPEYDFRLV